MTIVCAAKSCKYSSPDVDSSHIIFINFPNDDTSKIWAHHCGRTDLLMKSNEEIHLNYYLCSHHIEDRYYINKHDPIIIEQNAIPTLFDTDQTVDKENPSLFNRNEVNEQMSLPYSDMVEVDQYQEINMRFSNLCRICGEPPSDPIEIFNEKGIKLKLKDKIGMYMPISIDMSDLMPQKICMSCYSKLEMTHSLTVTCLKTDMRFKRFLNIIGAPEYDNKYREIIEECALELTQEMCMESTAQSENLDISGDKVGRLDDNYDLATEQNNIGDNNAETDDNIHQASLENLLECYDKLDGRKTSPLMKNIDNYKSLSGESNKEPTDNQICSARINVNVCEDCQQHFDNQEMLDQHKLLYCEKPECVTGKSVDSNKPENNIVIVKDRRCGHCNAVYTTKKELLTHINELHGGELLFRCFSCDKTYEKWSGLDVHEATHRLDKPYLCDLCGKSFKHSNNLRGHKRIHMDESRKKRHVCDQCGSGFRSRFHLREHMNQHEDTKPYSCEECGKAFHKRIQLRQHKLSHGSNKHICPICGTAFNRRGNMTAHFKRHNNDEMYTCSVCTDRYKTMSELLLHRKLHTKEEIVESIKKKLSGKAIWECKICNRVFSKRAVLSYHERIHTGEKIRFDCDQCDKKLSTKQSLVYHKKCAHSMERPHMCQYCGEAFVSKEMRQIHERVHTGERPYVCKVCNMQYKCSSNLNQHMKTHSGIKPHKCNFCHKSFTRKDTLIVHERIHSGMKPFPCQICGRGFTQRNDMLKHSKTHNLQLMNCEQCSDVFTRKKDLLKHMSMHTQNNQIIN